MVIFLSACDVSFTIGREKKS